MGFHSLTPTLVPGSQASPLSTLSHTICWGQPGSWYLARLTSSAESRSFRKSMVCSRVSELFSWHCVWGCWGYTWRWHCSVVEVCMCSTLETCGCICWSSGTGWHPPSVCEVHWLHLLEWLLSFTLFILPTLLAVRWCLQQLWLGLVKSSTFCAFFGQLVYFIKFYSRIVDLCVNLLYHKVIVLYTCTHTSFLISVIYLFLAAPWSMWDLSSTNKYWTSAPCSGSVES